MEKIMKARIIPSWISTLFLSGNLYIASKNIPKAKIKVRTTNQIIEKLEYHINNSNKM